MHPKKIFVKTLAGKIFTLTVDLEDTIGTVKNHINEKEGITADKYFFFCEINFVSI
jgi:hypothetical protein